MIAVWGWVISVTVLISGALSELDDEICTLVKTSCGLVPPILPENFEIQGERVDFVTKSKAWEEMYFDNTYLRGKYMTIEGGFEYHLLFDYNVSQILSYGILHSGDAVSSSPLSHQCEAKEMEDSEQSFIFGYRDGTFETKHSRMFDANRVLRFGGPYAYAFNGTGIMDNRGLNTNSFLGCVYEENIQATSAILYNFTGDHVVPAGGILESEIDNTEEIGYESVPIGAHVRGSAYETTSNGSKEAFRYRRSHSFSWFKANPVFEEQNFQIPPWMHCLNYRGWKKMPNFPLAFSVRLETTAFKQDKRGKKVSVGVTSVDQLFYYNEKALARRDYTPTTEKDLDIINVFGNQGRLKTVYDFKTGAMYITHLATGRCYTRGILKDFFRTSKQILYVEMAKPDELFEIEEENMQYKGQYFFRDINCDAWSGGFSDKETNVTTIKETYMSTNGWHSEADESVQYGVPVRHTIISYTEQGEIFQTVKEYNFFKFKAFAPTLALFDVSECVETTEHKFYAIILNNQEDGVQQNIAKYTFQFLEASQYYLADISQVRSPLRVQRIDLESVRSMILLTFALVEKPNLQTEIPPQIEGAEVKDAANFIRKIVDEGDFRIEFPIPKTKETQVVTANPGSMYAWFPTGKQRSENKDNEYAEEPPSQKTPLDQRPLFGRHNWVLYSDTSPNKKGMKPGAFAALAICMLLMGIAIGIAGMYFYIRKFHGNKSEIEFPLEKQTT